jgi:hypothetical protein
MADSKHSGYVNSVAAGTAQDFGASYQSNGWVMTPTSFAPDSQIALEISPDNTTWTRFGLSVGGRPVICFGTHVAARYARINVVALGTNPPGGAVGAVLHATQ